MVKAVSFSVSSVRKWLCARTSLGPISSGKSCRLSTCFPHCWLCGGQPCLPAAVIPRWGGRRPRVLPPRRLLSAAGCGEAVTQLSVTKAAASAQISLCTVRHFLYLRLWRDQTPPKDTFSGAVLLFLLSDPHGGLRGCSSWFSSAARSESVRAASSPCSPRASRQTTGKCFFGSSQCHGPLCSSSLDPSAPAPRS